jgi:hypothetical protein
MARRFLAAKSTQSHVESMPISALRQLYLDEVGRRSPSAQRLAQLGRPGNQRNMGYVGVLIALDAMPSNLLADSGGADKVVESLLRDKGGRAALEDGAARRIVSIPLFFEIGLCC